jgi:membrane-bound lytic murein transglycosylase D
MRRRSSYLQALFLFWCFVGLVGTAAGLDVTPALLRELVPDSLTYCGEEVPLGTCDVRERLEKELLLMLQDEGQIILWLKRAPRVIPAVATRLQDRRMPDDLKYLPVIESSLKPQAYSSARAAGYWQFVRGTARRYGLICGNTLDERYDLGRATKAALDYLQDIHEMLGSWLLALAGYNWGEDRVADAIKEQGVSSYFELRMPRETEAFVLRAVAVKLIFAGQAALGLEPMPEDCYHPEAVDTVTVKVLANYLPLTEVAKLAGTTYREIRRLNPQLISKGLTNWTYQIRLPAGCGPSFEKKYDPEKYKPKVVYHLVKRGESLSGIAGRYGVTVRQIMQWNGLRNANRIYVGQRLAVSSPG